MRVLATDTAACCSSALAASLADSASMSIELPSACVAPTEPSTCVAKLGVARPRARRPRSPCAAVERAVEVDVDAAVAGRRRVGDVGGKRLMALCGAGDGALERQLSGIDQHGTEDSWRERGGGPSLDLTRLRPWSALPLSAARFGTFRVWTRLEVDAARYARPSTDAAAGRGLPPA